MNKKEQLTLTIYNKTHKKRLRHNMTSEIQIWDRQAQINGGIKAVNGKVCRNTCLPPIVSGTRSYI